MMKFSPSHWKYRVFPGDIIGFYPDPNKYPNKYQNDDELYFILGIYNDKFLLLNMRISEKIQLTGDVIIEWSPGPTSSKPTLIWNL